MIEGIERKIHKVGKFKEVTLGIGLLRTLLAISVVIAHSSLICGYNIVDGTIAVQSFYMISGFYMSLILNEKYTNNFLFYTNRILRLYPIYLTVVILTIGLSIINHFFNGQWNKLSFFVQYYNQMSISTLLFLIFTNLTMIGQDIVMFLGLDLNGGLFFTPDFHKEDPSLYNFLLVPQAWTLGIEITFYFLAPWLVRKSTKVLVLILVLDIGLRMYLRQVGFSDDPWNYRFFPIELAFFIMGAIAYKYYVKLKSKLNSTYLQSITIFIIVFTLMFDFIPVNYTIKQWAYYILVMFSIPYIFIYSKHSSFDRQIGDLSYSIYISHILVIIVLQLLCGKFFPSILKSDYYGIVVSMLTIIFAIGLQKYIQVPIDEYREERMVRKRS